MNLGEERSGGKKCEGKVEEEEGEKGALTISSPKVNTDAVFFSRLSLTASSRPVTTEMVKPKV